MVRHVYKWWQCFERIILTLGVNSLDGNATALLMCIFEIPVLLSLAQQVRKTNFGI